MWARLDYVWQTSIIINNIYKVGCGRQHEADLTRAAVTPPTMADNAAGAAPLSKSAQKKAARAAKVVSRRCPGEPAHRSVPCGAPAAAASSCAARKVVGHTVAGQQRGMHPAAPASSMPALTQRCPRRQEVLPFERAAFR